MNNAPTQQPHEFLNDIFNTSKLDLRASTGSKSVLNFVDISGSDAPLLRVEGGELLDAVEHLVNQIFARTLEGGERYVCDVDGFRAVREAELCVMARHAADRVRASGGPFTFGAMTANERRVIHLALASEEGLATESVGEGNARRLRVTLKSSV